MINNMKIYLILHLIFSTALIYSSDIAVCTMAIGDEYKNIVKLAIENKQLYCNKHSYQFFCTDIHLDPTRPFSWSKVKMVEYIFETEKPDWVFWTDADSLITNMSITLESLIDNNFDIVISVEDDKPVYNCGQFIIKNSEWSKQFLSKLYYGHPDLVDHGWWEQGSFIKEMENDEVRSHVKVLPQRSMNSFTYLWETNDFLIHFASARGDFLRRNIEDYLKYVHD